jgi:disulfide bond formation protein DsbB
MTGKISNDMAAALLAGCVSTALMIGVYIFQYGLGYMPCELCIWQRYPHGVSILVGIGGGVLMAFGFLPASLRRVIALIAILAIAISGAIGIYHAGVEWKFWPGPTSCTAGDFTPGPTSDFKPFHFVPCDDAAWRFLGLSLAGYNALISLATAFIAARLLRKEIAA